MSFFLKKKMLLFFKNENRYGFLNILVPLPSFMLVVTEMRNGQSYL